MIGYIDKMDLLRSNRIKRDRTSIKRIDGIHWQLKVDQSGPLFTVSMLFFCFESAFKHSLEELSQEKITEKVIQLLQSIMSEQVRQLEIITHFPPH